MVSVQVESGCQNRNVTGTALSFQALSKALGTWQGPGQKAPPPRRDSNESCSQISKVCPKVSFCGSEGSFQVPGPRLTYGKPFSTASTLPDFSPILAPSLSFFSEPTRPRSLPLSPVGGAGTLEGWRGLIHFPGEQGPLWSCPRERWGPHRQPGYRPELEKELLKRKPVRTETFGSWGFWLPGGCRWVSQKVQGGRGGV